MTDVVSRQRDRTSFGETWSSVRDDGLENQNALLYLKAMGKPTMTYRSKAYKPAAVKYLQEFCPAILAGFNRAAKFQSAQELRLYVTFATETDILWNTPHDKKPDMTNILKGIEDALLIDDSKVAVQVCHKTWGAEDTIVIHLFGVTR